MVLVIRDEDGAGDAAAALVADLKSANVRVRLDARTETSFGRRATEWELKGVPIRVEVGPRDLVNGEVTVARRDTGGKEQMAVASVAGALPAILEDVQAGLFARALAHREANTATVATIDEARDAAQTGFARIPWAVLGDEGEATLAKDAITVRCLQTEDGEVPASEDEPGVIAIVSRAY